MRPGEHTVAHLSPEEGFGRYDASRRATVTRTQLPVDVSIGGFVRSSQGAMARVVERVVEMDDHAAVLDLNHPLARQSIDIEVTIVDVESVHGTFAEPAADRTS